MRVKPPNRTCLFAEKGIDWLPSLNLEPVESCLTVIKPLDNEIKRTSKHLSESAEDNEDVKLLMTIPGAHLIVTAHVEVLEKCDRAPRLVFLLYWD
jgi:transposase